MGRKVPFEINFKQAKCIAKIATSLLCAFVTLQCVIFICNVCSLELDIAIIKVIASILSLVYTITITTHQIVFYLAEDKNLEDLIDNAYDTNYADENSEGYYNNRIEPGIEKLALNTYESSFFTHNLLCKMINKKIWFAFFSLLIVVSLFVYNRDSSLTYLFIDLAAPVIYFSNFISLIIYYNRTKTINDGFSAEFQNKEPRIERILKYTIQYQRIKAWSNLDICSKTFFKHNADLSARWERKIESIENKHRKQT